MPVTPAAACAVLSLLVVVRADALVNQADIQTVADWIDTLQYDDPAKLSHGGIRFHDNAAHIADGVQYFQVEPYFANLGVVGLLNAPVADRLEIAEEWMGWYLSHLDTSGVDTSIVYRHWYLADGTGETTAPDSCDFPGKALCNYDDASDSYAATFLDVAWTYVETGGDVDFFSAAGYKEKLEGIAAVILRLQQADGLTWAKSAWQFKYTMDNSEVYSGLISMSRLQDQVFGDETASQTYADAAEEVRLGIENELYNSGTQLYRVAKNPDDTFTEADAVATVWYVDATAQARPHLFGVSAVNSATTQTVMGTVNAGWDGTPSPDWTNNFVGPNGFPWTSMGFAALLSGDDVRAQAQVSYVVSQKLPDFDYPMTVADAGWLLRLLSPAAIRQTVVSSEDTPTVIALTGRHLDGAALTMAIGSQPSGGNVTISGGDATYTPDANVNGTDSFAFTVSDGQVTSIASTVSIQVDAVNDPPTLSALADLNIAEDTV